MNIGKEYYSWDVSKVRMKDWSEVVCYGTVTMNARFDALVNFN